MRQAALGEIGDPPRQRGPAELGRRSAVVARRAGVGRQQSGENPQQGRLARPVGADQADELARNEVAIDAGERRAVAEADNDAARRDAHHASLRMRSIRP